MARADDRPALRPVSRDGLSFAGHHLDVDGKSHRQPKTKKVQRSDVGESRHSAVSCGHAWGEAECSGGEVGRVDEAVGDPLQDAELVVGAFDPAVGGPVGVGEGEDLVSPFEEGLGELFEFEEGHRVEPVSGIGLRRPQS